MASVLVVVPGSRFVGGGEVAGDGFMDGGAPPYQLLHGFNFLLLACRSRMLDGKMGMT